MVERESNKHREKPAAGPVIPSSLESQEIWEAVTLPAVSQPFTLLNLPLPGTIGSPRAPTPRGSAHPVPPLLPHSAAAPGHLSATWWPPVELPHRPPPRRALSRCCGAWLGVDGGGRHDGPALTDGASHWVLLRAEGHKFDWTLHISLYPFPALVQGSALRCYLSLKIIQEAQLLSTEIDSSAIPKWHVETCWQP